MSISGTLGDAFEATMDWLTDGSTPWAMTKLIGAWMIALGLIASPFAYVAMQNAQALQTRIESLDTRPTHIFNNVASCMQAGYTQADCTASMKEAFRISEGLGTTLKYSSASECFAIHATCQQITMPVTTYIRVGESTIPVTNYITNFHPSVVGWQAARDNIAESVPLYQSAQPGMAVRVDKVQFQMP